MSPCFQGGVECWFYTTHKCTGQRVKLWPQVFWLDEVWHVWQSGFLRSRCRKVNKAHGKDLNLNLFNQIFYLFIYFERWANIGVIWISYGYKKCYCKKKKKSICTFSRTGSFLNVLCPPPFTLRLDKKIGRRSVSHCLLRLLAQVKSGHNEA